MSGEQMTELINSLAKEFVTKSIGDVVKAGGTFGDVMVLVESTLVGAMLANVKVFNMKEHVSASLVEMAVHRAMERFAAQQNKELS